MAEDKKSLLIEDNIQNLIEQEKISEEVIKGIKSSQNKSLKVMLASSLSEGTIRLGIKGQSGIKSQTGRKKIVT